MLNIGGKLVPICLENKMDDMVCQMHGFFLRLRMVTDRWTETAFRLSLPLGVEKNQIK